MTGSGTITTASDQVSGIDLSDLADGTITLSVTLTDPAGNTGSPATDNKVKDTTPPSGYSVSIDQSPINSGNSAAVSFTFSGAETGAAYNYSFTSDGGGATVTGSGTITTASDQVTGIDLSGIPDGTITLSVTLTDPVGNTGSPATGLGTKDTGAITVVITSDASNPTNSSPIEIMITFSEVVTGFTLGDLVVGNGTAGNLEGSGASYTAAITPASDGPVTVDIPANVALSQQGNKNQAADRWEITYNQTAPEGFSVTFMDEVVNILNERNVGFGIENAEIGSSYEYTLTSLEDGTFIISSSGTISSGREERFEDLSAFPNGSIELAVVLIDAIGNRTAPVTDRIIKVSGAEAQRIPQGFSPNGDGVDDTWVIPGIEQFPNNRVKIFNRNGAVVWQAAGYDNNGTVWDSQANTGTVFGSSGLPAGTYYYVIEYGDGQTDVRTGFITLKR